MSMGMTYEQYWYGDTYMARAFYKADKLKREQRDENAWLIGAYVCRAIESTIGNAFLKKGCQPIEYPDMPKFMEKRLREDEERRRSEEQEEKDRVFALAWMSNFVQAGKNWGKNKRQKE